MPVHALPHLGMGAQPRRDPILDEAAKLDRRAHLVDADMRFIALAAGLEVERGAEGETLRLEYRETEALIGRLEIERFVPARDRDVDQGAQAQIVRARIGGAELRT